MGRESIAVNVLSTVCTYLACCGGFLLIRHAHDGQHEVDEVERPEEDDNDEEDNVPRTIRTNHLQIFHIFITNVTLVNLSAHVL